MENLECHQCKIYEQKIDELEKKVSELTGAVSCRSIKAISRSPYDNLAIKIFQNPKLTPAFLSSLDYTSLSAPVPTDFISHFYFWVVDGNINKAVAFILCIERSNPGSLVVRDILNSVKDSPALREFYEKCMRDVFGLCISQACSIEEARNLYNEYVENVLSDGTTGTSSIGKLLVQSDDVFRWEFFRTVLWPSLPNGFILNGRQMSSLEVKLFEGQLELIILIYQMLHHEECRVFVHDKMKFLFDNEQLFQGPNLNSAKAVFN